MIFRNCSFIFYTSLILIQLSFFRHFIPKQVADWRSSSYNQYPSQSIRDCNPYSRKTKLSTYINGTSKHIPQVRQRIAFECECRK